MSGWSETPGAGQSTGQGPRAVLDRAQRRPEGVSIYLSTDGSGGVPTEALKMVLRSGGLVVG